MFKSSKVRVPALIAAPFLTVIAAGTVAAAPEVCNWKTARDAANRGDYRALCECQQVTPSFLERLQTRSDFATTLQNTSAQCPGLSALLTDLPTASITASGNLGESRGGEEFASSGVDNGGDSDGGTGPGNGGGSGPGNGGGSDPGDGGGSDSGDGGGSGNGGNNGGGGGNHGNGNGGNNGGGGGNHGNGNGGNNGGGHGGNHGNGGNNGGGHGGNHGNGNGGNNGALATTATAMVETTAAEKAVSDNRAVTFVQQKRPPNQVAVLCFLQV
ncbi:hypothetical protein [Ruegeria profundi]|uniref:Uncharacterized protein n=1 Tax=Ruegeria profundi TaxID=1685378 RepID=A0A0X3U217_9RHOB|nr:hypothetical protein [Ruegeria profundi]KUJ82048.1 hypothetical protein AVO44_01885 [Ruegeria profundi]